MDKENLILFGCGAMALEVCEYTIIANKVKSVEDPPYIISDVVSTDFKRLRDIEEALGHEVARHTSLETVADFHQKKSLIAIGSACAIAAISRQVRDSGGEFASIVHPSAHISPLAELSEGVIVAPFVFVGPRAVVGPNSILNVRSTIGHDAKLGRGVVVSPHVDVNGGAAIADHVFLGAGVVVDPLVAIGVYCKISAGTAIRRSIPAGHLAFPSPAKSVRMFDSETGQSLFR